MPNNVFAWHVRQCEYGILISVHLYPELEWSPCTDTCGGTSAADAEYCEDPNDPTEPFMCTQYNASCYTEACNGKFCVGIQVVEHG